MSAKKPESPGAFPPTRWSIVVGVGAEESQVAADALDTLCSTYWYPLYSFVRRSGYSPDDAQDWTQAFFEYVLETRAVTKADPQKGRFRTYMLACLKNFLSTERRRQAAAKRGGGRRPLSLDERDAEDRYLREPVDEVSPDMLYERSWARTVLAGALEALRKEYVAARKEKLFKLLEPYLQSQAGAPSYRATAEALGKSENAVGAAVQRVRQRFHQVLRGQIAETVTESGQVDDELSHLRQVLTR